MILWKNQPADREAQRKKSGTGTDEKADPSGKSRLRSNYFLTVLISGMLKNRGNVRKRTCGSRNRREYFNSAVICMFMENWQRGKDNGRRWKWNSIPIISVTDCWNVRRSFLGQKVNLRKWSILAQGFFAVFLIFPETAGHRLCSRD